MHPGRGGGGEYGDATTKGDGDNLEGGGNHHHPTHHLKFSGMALKITLLFAVVIITCLLLNQSTYPIEFFRSSNSFSRPKDSNISSLPSCENRDAYSSSFHQHTSQNLLSPEKEENRDLETTLRKAAMKENRTVIITTLNAAWTEPNSVFDLFLESFRIGNGTAELLKHVVVGAFDQTAYNRCLAEGLHCYAVTTDGVDFSGEAFFMSEDYLKMMWRRIDFLRNVLELGYDFVFTDADVMWLRNPFERFYPDGDFQIACDHYWAEYKDRSNSPNGGFNYVRSNNRTIQFYKFWYTGQFYFPGKHDQDVLNFIKLDPFISQIGLEMRFLDTAYFGGFCEPSKDLDLVITMHANCCIGLYNKLHDIKMVIDDWKRYMSLPVDQRNSTIRSWTVPRICG
ncbi:Nucleotide-diphospho-sugar transferase family protein [Perilla frutescens var. hirtella]|nr:Nucleotide-diphospho-sugar transferase family protein [Perilla frutescens var. frutescens]KAH6783571.1 Nucleotide-diphospho-sugar transferase family protein [Perilla frutescens var. hirtella]